MQWFVQQGHQESRQECPGGRGGLRQQRPSHECKEFKELDFLSLHRGSGEERERGVGGSEGG